MSTSPMGRAGSVLWSTAVVLVFTGAGCDQKIAPSQESPDAALRSWETSTCGACELNACKDDVDACDAEPECARWLDCLRRCVPPDDGDVDSTCGGACALPEGDKANRDRQSVDGCRLRGAGRDCAGCSRSSLDGGTLPPLLTQTCPMPPMGGNVCGQCEFERCCDTFNACRKDADCRAIESCWLPCFKSGAWDGDCLDKCYSAHPVGMKAWAPRITCLQLRCGEACSGRPLDACLACSIDRCSLELATCGANPDCFRLSQCVGVCMVGEDACWNRCFDKFSAVRPLFDAGAICIQGECVQACPR